MKRLLLVEDDEGLGATLSERLSAEGYAVQWARSRQEAEQRCGVGDLRSARATTAVELPFDLIILDVGLPDGSGLDFARDLRFLTPIPMIFLSAMSSAEYRLEGFEIGAADYVPKPFHLRELLLRIQRVLATPSLPTHGGTEVQNNHTLFTLDREALAIVFPDGTRVHPIPRDFQLLCLLVDVSPRVLSREEILQRLWPNDTQQSGRTVDNAIVRLRQSLRNTHAETIRSVRGVGYQFLPNESTKVSQPERLK